MARPSTERRTESGRKPRPGEPRTGDCYEVAARLVTFGDDAEVDGWFVCHAWVTPYVGRLKGRTFGHAWVEVGDDVIDRSNGLDVRMGRDAYYVFGGIDPEEVHRYTATEARAEMVRTGHFGPWATELEGKDD